MDYVEMMQSFDSVLKRSPLSSTHWHIEKDSFVRMGDAVVNGYLNLNILRSLKSKDYVRGLSENELKQIYSCKPIDVDANAYSLETKQYLSLTLGGNKVINQNGHASPVSNPLDMQRVIFMNDVLSTLFNFNKNKSKNN